MFVIDSEDKLEMVLEGVDGVSVVEAGDFTDLCLTEVQKKEVLVSQWVVV